MTPTEVSTGDPDAAICDALATEHGVIYGYGIVSAYAAPELNYLVSDAIRQHRDRRDRVIAALSARSVPPPVAAVGYRPPMPVNDDNDAARLAVRLEWGTAAAWRAVTEQARERADRELAVVALTESAVLAARWNRALGTWPITQSFPGGPD